VTALIALILAILAAILPQPSEGVSPEAAWAVRGVASWYDLKGPGLYAAMPEWRWGDPAFRARVCTDSACVTVTVNDHCPCVTGRVIDLSADAFRRLAPLSQGLVAVEVTVGVDGPRPTPPSTSTAP
jgi:rare lipoprotein A (peptidoglycan hydrolase)